MADNNVVQGVVANAMPQEWISGLCGCFSSFGICCQTIMCELCTLTNIATKLHSNAGVCDCGTCCSICCCGTSCFIPCSARREVIQRFGIRGEGTCGSCVKATICCQCSLCQVQNEMAQRGEHCGGCCASGPPPQQQMMGAPGSPIQGGSMMAPKPWSTGLCACSGMECCEGFLCPCFVAGYMSAKFFDVLEGTNDPTNPRCDCCTTLCSLIPNSACCFYFMLRREAIARYRIWGESHCNTLCMLYWCFPCAIMQARREMGMHREWPGGCCVKEAPASVTDNLSNKPPA